MGSPVSLPLWVVLLMAILAISAALDRILIPSVRWALRRRANRAIEVAREPVRQIESERDPVRVRQLDLCFTPAWAEDPEGRDHVNEVEKG